MSHEEEIGSRVVVTRELFPSGGLVVINRSVYTGGPLSVVSSSKRFRFPDALPFLLIQKDDLLVYLDTKDPPGCLKINTGMGKATVYRH